MAIADLRKVAGLKDSLLRAADDLERAASVEQAISERLEHLSSLDIEVSKRVEMIKDLTVKFDSLSLQASQADLTLQESLSTRFASIEKEVGERRAAVEAAYNSRREELAAKMRDLVAEVGTVSEAVASLHAQREAINSEIDSAKNRVSQL